MRIKIASGRVIDPAQNIDNVQDLYIAAGQIIAHVHPPDGFKPDRTIDASAHIVCPGLIDLAARFREPGHEYKATIASESWAAVSGGITTVCYPPDTSPVIDTPAVAELVRERAKQANLVRIVTLGALTKGLQGVQISEMAALKEAGCVGVCNALTPIVNTAVMRRAMEYAATYDLTVFLHAQDSWLQGKGCVHEGTMSTRLGLPGIPIAAETVGVTRELALIEQTGARAHFCRLSSAAATRLIGRAQYSGLPVTADVSAYHLHLTEIDISDFNSQCHVLPPLRTQRDMEELRQGVRKNIIGAIVSDHQPHEADAKLSPFAETEPGISGLETLLPLSLRLADQQMMPLHDVLARLTSEPAKILGIDAGTLRIGAPADICIYDPNVMWQLREAEMISRGRNSPFFGWPFKGRNNYTLVGGRIVYERYPEKTARH